MRRVEPFPAFPTPATRRLSTYSYLARAIVFQQLAGKAASTIHRRVCALTPGAAFPSPQDLLSLPEAALRRAGLSASKTAAVQDLAARAADGRLKARGLTRLGDAGIVERLTEVRGIGEWTAQMFLLFKLGRLDVWPTGDLGVQEGVRILLDLENRPTPKELERIGEPWAPLRSVAAWTAWRLVDEARA